MLLAKRLAQKRGLHQSAFLYEFFRQPQFEEQDESEKALCITLDAHSAVAHEAPGNATYMFKEMTATCANLMERWPAIKAAVRRGAMTIIIPRRECQRNGPTRKATLTGGLFFALMGWLAMVFVSLLRIPGLFASHIAGIIMKLALRIFAGQLLIRVLVIGHRALLSR